MVVVSYHMSFYKLSFHSGGGKDVAGLVLLSGCPPLPVLIPTDDSSQYSLLGAFFLSSPSSVVSFLSSPFCFLYFAVKFWGCYWATSASLFAFLLLAGLAASHNYTNTQSSAKCENCTYKKQVFTYCTP